MKTCKWIYILLPCMICYIFTKVIHDSQREALRVMNDSVSTMKSMGITFEVSTSEFGPRSFLKLGVDGDITQTIPVTAPVYIYDGFFAQDDYCISNSKRKESYDIRAKIIDNGVMHHVTRAHNDDVIHSLENTLRHKLERSILLHLNSNTSDHHNRDMLFGKISRLHIEFIDRLLTQNGGSAGYLTPGMTIDILLSHMNWVCELWPSLGTSLEGLYTNELERMVNRSTFNQLVRLEGVPRAMTCRDEITQTCSYVTKQTSKCQSNISNIHRLTFSVASSFCLMKDDFLSNTLWIFGVIVIYRFLYLYLYSLVAYNQSK